MLILHTNHTDDGIELSFANGEHAGMIFSSLDCETNRLSWYFSNEDRSLDGPMRSCPRAAEYDALAYWEDKAVR